MSNLVVSTLDLPQPINYVTLSLQIILHGTSISHVYLEPGIPYLLLT